MREKLNLIIVVDTSGSMKGKGIGAANDAVLNVIQAVDSFARSGSLECSVIIIPYGDDASCSAQSPISEYVWNDASASGVTSFGKACEALRTFLDSRSCHPGFEDDKNLIVLFSDGTSTDDYTSRFCHLIESVPFQRADKVAVVIGRCHDEETLAAFTGDTRWVLTPDRIEEIQTLLFERFPEQ
jgi:uncharacterized protein YegL